MSEKIYVGNGKLIKTQHGELMKISFNKGDLQRMEQHLNEAGFVNLLLAERREPSQHGSTHYLIIDTWKPSK
jgi:hypothetical protein